MLVRFELLKNYIIKNIDKFEYVSGSCFESEHFYYKDLTINRYIFREWIPRLFRESKKIVKETFSVYNNDIEIEFKQEELSLLWEMLYEVEEQKDKLWEKEYIEKKEKKVADFFKKIREEK